MALPALTEVHMDPDRPVPVVGDGLMLAGLPSAALQAFVDTSIAGGLFTLELRHLEGELAHVRPENGALSSIPGKHALYAGGFAPTRDLAAAAHEQIETIKRALAPWTTSYIPPNFAETQRDPATLWPEPAYERLRQIKRAVDADNVIRANHQVPPAPA